MGVGWGLSMGCSRRGQRLWGWGWGLSMGCSRRGQRLWGWGWGLSTGVVGEDRGYGGGVGH